uniref:Formylglycine-generating enzyme, required for sulfatase activity, contains SUMF1/FGE domain n=1 Tax=Candidatus Kentrum eta TaxID=2126337 RepID=A0A450UMW5_9GAMM|nr:MAG: Formylglycine-generating enzyme, required for sulfatase activity, contains SUMF1/FGE domain [Candidatus Kentron sp. H]VFJ93877.1 MAG: Formylglycine-generating enzyme, required for sulfatase activity, contains SUMF1/FGE domain [Candidatus Kentron sp. H]VFK00388.1 MAG: Formylglycine-generating enzyme, required for sulfatase activity, contains SUMF1/FGE domain [Candidatus Kentron sp. H]
MRIRIILLILFLGPLSALPAYTADDANTADYTNSIGMAFKNIPAGSFYMGSCKLSEADKELDKKRRFLGLPPKGATCPSGGPMDDKADDNETPQHKVRISKGFQMGMHEVTLGQFKQFIVGAGRYDFLTDDFMETNSHGDNAAVSYVSWQDIQAFIRWLNQREGGNRYRLPTEAEWEYAARAGTTTIYSWGNSANQAGHYAWYKKNAWDVGDRYAHAVGGKRPNPWGLYDMQGNVRESTADCWLGNYESAPADGAAWGNGGDCSSHAVRGGSWDGGPGELRSSARNWDQGGIDFLREDIRHNNLGFRLVRD